MNRRQMLMATLPLLAAPTLVLAQDKKPPAAPAAKPKAKAEPRRDPYAPTEVAIRPDFEVGSIVVVSAVLPSNACTASGNPSASVSSPIGIWGSRRRSRGCGRATPISPNRWPAT